MHAFKSYSNQKVSILSYCKIIICIRLKSELFIHCAAAALIRACMVLLLLTLYSMAYVLFSIFDLPFANSDKIKADLAGQTFHESRK